MGHYCRVCGKTRSNEKFSGKGHKNHICKDCSGKSGKKAKGSSLNEESQVMDDLELLFGALVHSEEEAFGGFSFYDDAFEIDGSDDEDEDIPF